MAILSAKVQQYPTPTEIHQGLLTAVAYAYSRAGLPVNVAEGSEPWFRYRALAQFVSVAIANGKLAIEALNPLDAKGDDLISWASVFGVYPRGAGFSIGFVRVETILLTGGPTPVYATGGIPSKWRLTGPTGLEYETTSAQVVTNGTLVEVQAVAAGIASDESANSVMEWSDASLSFLKPEAVVASGGIADGTDEDDEEDLREALLRRLANPAGGGNPAQVQQTALNASAAISDCYTYPAVQGPASDDVCVIAGTGDRTLQPSTINKAALAIATQMPGSIRYNVTTANPEPVDVIIDIAAPLPQAAGGAGSGFRDAFPWPSSAETFPKGLITNVSGATITVNSTSLDPPKAGDRFGIWDPTFVNSGRDVDGNDLTGLLGKMREFTCQAVTGGSGAYVLTLDVAGSTALDFVVANESRVSCAMEKLTTYAKLFMLSMRSLGPGEKTDNVDILPFGLRNPGPGIAQPIGLSSLLLNRVADTVKNPEVLDIDYAARWASTTSTERLRPSLPASASSPPRILTLKYLAFRRLLP